MNKRLGRFGILAVVLGATVAVTANLADADQPTLCDSARMIVASPLTVGGIETDPIGFVNQVVIDARADVSARGGVPIDDHALESVPYELESEIVTVRSQGRVGAAFVVTTDANGLSAIDTEFFCLNEDGTLVDPTFQQRAAGDGELESEIEGDK